MRDRRAAAQVAAALLPFLLVGCGSTGPSATQPTIATTAAQQPVPTGALVAGVEVPGAVTEAQWREQANTWLKAHSPDLSGISGAAKVFGDALKVGDTKAATSAINDFLVKVGQTEVDLPANAFGHDLLDVMNEYVSALSTIRTGLVGNDQRVLAAGSSALSVAVAKFGVITARVKSTS